MTYTTPTPQQFELGENQVVHKPTGARFSAHPDSAEVNVINWSEAGSVLANGEDYDRGEILKIAEQLLRERLKK